MAEAEDLPEAGSDPQARDLLMTAGKTIYWIGYPIAVAVYYTVYYLAFAVVFTLKLVYRPLEFILLPVVYFGKFLFACLLAPFRFLARFETLYIYLGIGAIVGGVLGLLLAFIYGSLQGPLGLDSPPKQPGRTAKEYRQEKRKKTATAQSSVNSPGYLSPNQISMSDSSRRSGRGREVIGQTIMEEADSDN